MMLAAETAGRAGARRRPRRVAGGARSVAVARGAGRYRHPAAGDPPWRPGRGSRRAVADPPHRGPIPAASAVARRSSRAMAIRAVCSPPPSPTASVSAAASRDHFGSPAAAVGGCRAPTSWPARRCWSPPRWTSKPPPASGSPRRSMPTTCRPRSRPRVTEQVEAGFDPVSGSVLARRRRRLGALVLSDRTVPGRSGRDRDLARRHGRGAGA